MDTASDRRIFQRREILRPPQSHRADRIFVQFLFPAIDLGFTKEAEQRLEALRSGKRFAVEDFLQSDNLRFGAYAGADLRTNHKHSTRGVEDITNYAESQRRLFELRLNVAQAFSYAILRACHNLRVKSTHLTQAPA